MRGHGLLSATVMALTVVSPLRAVPLCVDPEPSRLGSSGAPADHDRPGRAGRRRATPVRTGSGEDTRVDGDPQH